MKLQTLLSEDFYKYFKYPEYMKDGHYPVFINPSKKEMREASDLSREKGTIRFIFDLDKKELYVFQSDVLHHIAKKKIFKDKTGLLMLGMARQEGNTWYASFSEFSGPGLPPELNKNHYKEALKLDISWMEKYLELTEIRSTFMLRYKEQKK